MRNEFDIKTLIGLTEEKAREIAGWNGFTFRVVQIDDVMKPGTADIKTNRLKVTLKEGIVTKVKIG